MNAIDGSTLEGVSATTLWPLHTRGVHAARDIPYPVGRGVFKLMSFPPLDRVGWFRRNRPSITALDFG